MDDCIFCKILLGTLPSSTVYRDNLCSVFLDIQPVNPGHVLVIPNKHSENLAGLDEETGAHLFRIGQRIAKALRQSGIKCEGINFFLADGEAAGQEVFHIHLHVFPRFKGDGFGLKFSPGYFTKHEKSELDSIAEQIKLVL
ncbi:MAG TPA: HIT family protein [Blastocatellia bacterium]|nr:HIT family protein [Blastocatellia bacterium]